MVEPLPFDVRVDESSDEVIVAIGGELDLATVPELRRSLDDVLGRARRVVIDLDALTFVDSSGIGALVSVQKDVAALGHELVVRRCSAPVRRVLSITGADSVITIEG